MTEQDTKDLARIMNCSAVPSESEWKVLRPALVRSLNELEQLQRRVKQLEEDAKHYEGLDF